MKKGILLICVGVAIGYWYGYKDARAYDRNVVTRVVERVGGSNRENFTTDVDTRMEKLER